MKQAAPVEMLEFVASSLGASLVAETAFVGGCVVPLLVTDPVVVERMRSTEDVDVIVEVLGYPAWYRLAEALRERGFREDRDGQVICRMRIDGLAVDFMPTDAAILGFSNRWYAPALQAADWHTLDSGRPVRVVGPVHFLATKVEAFEGRGGGDFLGSRDMEDILAVLDGREGIEREIAGSGAELRAFLAEKIAQYLCRSEFEYAVQSAADEPGREELLFAKLERVARGL